MTFDALVVGLLDDRRARPRIEVDEQDHLRAVRDRLLRLAGLGGRIALGVDDRVVDAGSRERLVQVLAVLGLPAHRRLACPGSSTATLPALLPLVVELPLLLRCLCCCCCCCRILRQRRRGRHMPPQSRPRSRGSA